MTTRIQRPEKSDRKSRWIILLLFLLLLIAIGVTLWALFFREETTLTPDYAPRREDKYAQSLDDQGDEKLEQVQGGGAVSLTYSTKVTVTLDDGMASVYFANPSKSNQDMVLQLVVQDVILAQSGRLSPGKQLDTLELLEGAASRLQPGGYNGQFVVLFYQPDTGEKTIVNTEIPVDVTVQ